MPPPPPSLITPECSQYEFRNTHLQRYNYCALHQCLSRKEAKETWWSFITFAYWSLGLWYSIKNNLTFKDIIVTFCRILKMISLESLAKTSAKWTSQIDAIKQLTHNSCWCYERKHYYYNDFVLKGEINLTSPYM